MMKINIAIDACSVPKSRVGITGPDMIGKGHFRIEIFKYILLDEQNIPPPSPKKSNYFPRQYIMHNIKKCFGLSLCLVYSVNCCY